MLTDLTFTASPQEVGTRLDAALLARCPTSSRAFCRQAIEAGRVYVNGRPGLKGGKLAAMDIVQVQRLKERDDNRVQPDPDVPVDLVFADEALLAFNKPAGIAVQPLSSDERGTLMNGAVARFPELAALGDQPLMAGALHRIDAETSGLVLAARSAQAFDALRAQFAAQTVEKRYLAVVEGHVAVPGRLTHDLAHHPGLAFCRMVDARSLVGAPRRLHAETAYRPLGFIGPNTLLEVTIFTGVTHQIRCQLALGGWPIVNDILYGARPVAGCTRHLLHALAARFTHPVSGRPCCIEAPAPEAFQPISEGQRTRGVPGARTAPSAR